MADERIDLILDATDKASPKVDKLADKVEDLEKLEPVIEPTIEESSAADTIDRIHKKLDQLDALEPTIEPKVDTSQAEAGIKKIGDSADQSRNVVANFAGNAAQDLGEIGGVAGSAGVAMGQFAEYAADGNINLRSLATAAAPLAAIAAVLGQIVKHFQEIEKRQAFVASKEAAWTESVRDGSDAVAILRKEVEETGKLEFATEFTQGVADFLPIIDQLGLSVEDVARLSSLSNEELAAWNDELEASGVSANDAAMAYYGIKAAGDRMAEAQGAAAATTRFLGEEAETAAEATERLTESYKALDAELSAQSAVLDVAQGWDDVKEAADAAFIAAATGSENAEEASRDYQQAVIDQKQRVADYAREVLGLPESAITEVLADLNEGSVGAAEAELEELARKRNAEIQVAVYIARIIDSHNLQARIQEAGGLSYIPSAPAVPTQHVYNFNIPRGTRPADMVAAGRRHARRNGVR